MFDQALGSGPGLGLGLAYDGVKADAKADLAALLFGPRPHIGNLFGNGFKGLAPCQIGIDMFGRQIMRRLG